jgi:hypothetical protein
MRCWAAIAPVQERKRTLRYVTTRYLYVLAATVEGIEATARKAKVNPGPLPSPGRTKAVTTMVAGVLLGAVSRLRFKAERLARHPLVQGVNV